MRQSIKLDLSGHSLNNSLSKQKFSFSKSARFHSPGKLICDSFYEIPTTKARRTTSFGYGNKTLGISYNKQTAPVGTYELGSQFKVNLRKGFGFGKGRQQMQITGPLRQSMLKQYIPGPGNYPIKSYLQEGNITLKSRIPDHSYDQLRKVPGPGSYEYEQLGSGRYNITSKYQNTTNRRISNSKRSSSFANKSSNLAANSYDISITDINPTGRYILSKQENSRVRQFAKGPRDQLVYKHMLTTPGPGTYQPFSDFGPL